MALPSIHCHLESPRQTGGTVGHLLHTGTDTGGRAEVACSQRGGANLTCVTKQWLRALGSGDESFLGGDTSRAEWGGTDASARGAERQERSFSGWDGPASLRHWSDPAIVTGSASCGLT